MIFYFINHGPGTPTKDPKIGVNLNRVRPYLPYVLTPSVLVLGSGLKW